MLRTLVLVGLTAALSPSQSAQESNQPRGSATETSYLSCTVWNGREWSKLTPRSAQTPPMQSPKGIRAYGDVKIAIKDGSCENTTTLYVASGVGQTYKIAYAKVPSASDGNGIRLIGWSPGGSKLLAEVNLWKYETDIGYDHVAVIYDAATDSAKEIPALNEAVSRHFGRNCEFELAVMGWKTNEQILVEVSKSPEDNSYEQHSCVKEPHLFAFDLARKALQIGPHAQRKGNANAGLNCPLPQDFHVERVDKQGKRLFVEGPENSFASKTKIASYLKKLDEVIERCEPSWKASWSVSFFSDPKLAGYKTDSELQGAVENGDWGRAYIAEYDRSTQILTIFPLDPAKRRTSQVIVSR